MCFYNHKVILFLITLSTLIPMKVHAVTASPDPVTLTQPDGFTFQARMRGDEYVSWRETLDGYTITKVGDEWFYAGLDINDSVITTSYSVGSLTATELSNFDKSIHAPYLGTREKHTPRKIKKSMARAPFTQKALVILVEFSDRTLTYTAAGFEDSIFDADSSASTSVKDFFSDNSYGDFTITPATESQGTANDGVIIVTLGTAHPNGSTSGNKAAVSAALTAADVFIDYSSFDTDGNGSVEADELSIICIFAGNEGSLSGSPIPKTWGHKSSITTVMLDSVGLSPYTAFGEIHDNGTTSHPTTIGIMCHELGHLMLGLPDLYDTDDTSEGIGEWGLMGSGSWNRTTLAGDTPSFLCAWSRAEVGYSTPTVITSSSIGTTIASTNTTSDIKEFWIDKYKSPLGIYSERFLVENRQLSGYDAGLPGSGLLIFHIDESQPDNTDETHKKVDVEEANNDGDLDSNVNRGDTGDPFPGSSGNTTFDGTSTPNSNDYTSTATGIAVSSISASMTTMTANFTPHATGGTGDTLNHDDKNFNSSGGFGFTGIDNWTAIEHTNTTTMDMIEGFEIYCSAATTVDFYFYTSMTANVPTTKIGTEETGFVASAGWNRFLLATPLSFPVSSTRVMVLKIANPAVPGTNYPQYVTDNTPNDKAWLNSSGPGGTYTHLTVASIPTTRPYDWRQHMLLGSSAIVDLTDSWLDFAWAGTEKGTSPEPFNTFDEALAAVASAGTVKIKGDTATSSESWIGSIDQLVTINAVSGTISIGD